MNLPLFLFLSAAAPLLFATAADNAPTTDRAGLSTILAEKSFWDRQPDNVWTGREVALLADLADFSEDPIVRVRATKLLIDVSGNGRATGKDSALVTASFRYLEQHPQDPAIVRMLAAPRMTHYTVSSHTDGSTWFLIETAKPREGGGLNFRWDAEKQQVELVKSWGSLAQK